MTTNQDTRRARILDLVDELRSGGREAEAQELLELWTDFEAQEDELPAEPVRPRRIVKLKARGKLIREFPR
ncbi:MAG: hypothetical protein AMS19_02460 [Gemmatimonas sp. SG8_23]|jgi:hypothetical protein|nr:MAG: hypothetical protein AMS19_02460 [Gemmatimonas sp. SG8_23]